MCARTNTLCRSTKCELISVVKPFTCSRIQICLFAFLLRFKWGFWHPSVCKYEAHLQQLVAELGAKTKAVLVLSKGNKSAESVGSDEDKVAHLYQQISVRECRFCRQGTRVWHWKSTDHAQSFSFMQANRPRGESNIKQSKCRQLHFLHLNLLIGLEITRAVINQRSPWSTEDVKFRLTDTNL